MKIGGAAVVVAVLMAGVWQAAAAVKGAESMRTTSFDLPAPGQAVLVSGSLGKLAAPWTLSLRGPDPKAPAASLVLTALDPMEGSMDVRLTVPDRPGFKQGYFTKPDLKFYVDESRRNRFVFHLADQAAFDERKQVADKYHLFRSVLEHPFAVRLERTAKGVDLWLDGRYLDTLPPGLVSGTVSSAESVPATSAVPAASLWQDRFLPVDLKPYHRPGSLGFESQPSNMPADAVTAVAGVPMLADAKRGALDVGLSRWLEEKIDPADFCDTDTTRSAFDGNPESLILRLPRENFMAAHVLCVVEPDPARTPVLTLRLTRFGNHYGDSGGRSDQAIGDTTIYLPTNPAATDLPQGVERVGEADVSLLRQGRWAAAREKARLPVYRVTLPLQTGKVSDLLGEEAPDFGRRGNFWDLELTKEIRTAVQYLNLQSCRIKPLGLPSAVHVIGLTLEKSPVDVTVSAKERGNVFYAGPDAAFDLGLVNHQAGPVTVEVTCDITDYYGVKAVRKASIAVPRAAENGGAARGRLPLDLGALGYFDAVVTVRLPDGREVWREPTSFALLPPDTRQAGDESPFGVWWFAESHGGCKRLDWMGPLLMKMGVRHCCPGPFSEAELKPYKLSYSMASWPLGKREALLKKNPSIRLGMIFHEKSIPGTDAIPPELLGRPKPELTEAGKVALDKYWKEGLDAAAWYRSNYPGMKISLGNSPSGISCWFMRQGWPKDKVDCFAMEGVAAWMAPECQPRRSALQEVWWLSEMRKLYGYGDVPVSSGYEYITRCSQPGALTEREQGEFHARDVLHALAYGYPSINVGLADDCADSYYSTIYGGSGFMRRNPLLTPKPGYVLYATLTRVLDRARYSRWLDTGSYSLYALEFKREKGMAYAVWTCRGQRELTFRTKGGAAVFTDAMGNARKLAPKNGRITVTASTAPVYLETDSPVEVESLGAPVYADSGRAASPLAAAMPIDDLSDPSRWSVSPERDLFLETYADDIPYVRGEFTLKPVKDADLGDCTEVELQPLTNESPLVARYVSLDMKEPVKLGGPAKRIGMWVRGNSGWGRVFWEFEDAKGERWFSAATEGAGWDVSDWRGRSAINFDGWCFLSLAVPERYPGGYHGPTDHDWTYSGGDGDGIVQHPVTLKRVVVALREKQVYVTDLVPARSLAIRLGPLVAEGWKEEKK